MAEGRKSCDGSIYRNQAVREAAREAGRKQPLTLGRAVILTKFTRLEYYRLRNDHLPPEQLEEYLKAQGIDYDSLLHHHTLHKDLEKHFQAVLERHGVETKIADRFTYSDEMVAWADAVFSAGGDGTFLLAASRVRDGRTPVIGLNTDPVRSEGRLCLPHVCAKDFESVVMRLKKGHFQWLFRTRIRVNLHGKSNGKEANMELEDNAHPDVQFFDSRAEARSMTLSWDTEKESVRPRLELPLLALNEAFMAERLSARVSNLVMVADGRGPWRLKCSGVCACTGSGSTSWHLSINRLSAHVVQDIMRILEEEEEEEEQEAEENRGKAGRGETEGKERKQEKEQKRMAKAKRVADRFNDALVHPVTSAYMVYSVRDLILAEAWPAPRDAPQRGHAQRLEVRSVCLDGALVVDGLATFAFNEGAVATLEVRPEDRLRTLALREFMRPNER